MSTVTILGRAAGPTAAGLLASAGALHLLWASGSPWPAASRERLAEVVVGSSEVPGAIASTAVGSGLILAAVAAGSGSTGRAVRSARWGTAAALATRAGFGGAAATRILGLPDPSPRFLTWDARFYRPLCAVIAASLVGADLRALREAGR